MHHQCEIKFNSLFLLWLSHSFNAAASKAMLFFYGGNRWKEAALWPTITCEGVITVIFESKTTFPRVSNSRTNDKICCSKILQTNIFASEIFFSAIIGGRPHIMDFLVHYCWLLNRDVYYSSKKFGGFSGDQEYSILRSTAAWKVEDFWVKIEFPP